MTVRIWITVLLSASVSILVYFLGGIRGHVIEFYADWLGKDLIIAELLAGVVVLHLSPLIIMMFKKYMCDSTEYTVMVEQIKSFNPNYPDCWRLDELRRHSLFLIAVLLLGPVIQLQISIGRYESLEIICLIISVLSLVLLLSTALIINGLFVSWSMAADNLKTCKKMNEQIAKIIKP